MRSHFSIPAGSVRSFLRIHSVPQKLLLTGGYLILLFLLHAAGMPCIFRSLTTLPCPGCGMTRAILSALRLRFGEALRFHGMFWSMPLLYAYFLADGHLFGKKTDLVLLSGIALGFLLNWAVQIVVIFS